MTDMEQTVAFVRDNPFFKNDGCRRLLRRAPLVSPRRPTVTPVVVAELQKKADMTTSLIEDGCEEPDNVSLGSDMEYGPGIVEKLKAKFHRLSGISSREVKGRRSSMEDFYASGAVSPPPANVPLSASQRLHSKSTGDMMDSNEVQRFTVHRVVRIEPDDEPVQTPSITNLRRRFDPNARPLQTNYSRVDNVDFHRPTSTDVDSQQIRTDYGAPVSENCYGTHRPAEIEEHRPVEPEPDYRTVDIREPPPPRSHIRSPVFEQRGNAVGRRQKFYETYSSIEGTQEPEFVRVGRQLRRSSVLLDDYEVKPELTTSTALYDRTPSINGRVSPPPSTLSSSAIAPFTATDLRCSKPLAESEAEPKYSRTEAVRRIDLAPKPSTIEKEVEQQPTRKYFLRREAHLPTLSGQARVVHESAGTAYRPVDFALPPDPDSARTRDPPAIVPLSPPTYPSSNDPQSSPPPEEPTPRAAIHPLITSDVQAESKSIKEHNATRTVAPPRPQSQATEDNGVSELHQLLSRFQRSRESRESEPIASQATRPFVSAVVGVRSYPDPDVSTFSPRATVVSISVRDEQPSTIANQRSDDVAAKRPAPPPPEPPVVDSKVLVNEDVSPAQAPLHFIRQPTAPKTVDFSYSSSIAPSIPQLHPPQFVPAAPVETNNTREKPYGDDVVELKTLTTAPSPANTSQELRESSVDEEEHHLQNQEEVKPPVSEMTDYGWSSDEDGDDLLSSRPMHIPLEPVPIRAGDGNLVRHTLLSLAMKEDIPLLLEAMAEKNTFEFVDLEHNKPSTSSIIHPPDIRKQRRIGRQVSSIKFETVLPEVYTYLDETSAYSSNSDWVEGVIIDYKAYEEVKKEEIRELERQSMDEFTKWKTMVASSAEIAAADDFLMSSLNFSQSMGTSTDESTLSV